jgi:O-antigen/teichoic acid export membrane protein
MSSRAWLGTFGTNAATLGNGVITGILAARLLGPDDRGALAVIVFWPSLLVGVGLCSLNEAVIYRLGRTRLPRSRFIGTLMALAGALGVLTIPVGLLVLPLLLGPDRAAWLKSTELYFIALVPVGFLGLTLLSLDHGEQKFTQYNILTLLPSTIYIILLIFCWASEIVSVSALLWAGWAGACATTLVRLGRGWRVAWGRPSCDEAQALMRTSLSFHATALLVMLTGQADRVVVMSLFGDGPIGQYAVALVLASAGLAVITQATHTVLFPRLAAEPDRGEAIGLMSRTLRRVGLPLLLGTLGLAATIPWLLPLLFGTAFRDAVPPAVVLTVAYLPLALRQIVIRSLRAFGDGRSGTLAEAMALAGFLLAVWPLCRFVGLVGVGLALLVANLAALAWLAHRLRAHYGLRPSTWLMPDRTLLADARLLLARLPRVGRLA